MPNCLRVSAFETIWESRSWNARLARTLLVPLSWSYTLGWATYRSIYDLGLKNSSQPHRPIICIGNLVVGGTGKTPLAIWVADLLVEQGRSVAISCSGYGSPAQEKAQLAPTVNLEAQAWGDEPAMIRWLRPNIPLIVGRDRVVAAEICNEHFPKSVLILDDGFQHLPLKKNISILIEPPSPNHYTLPAGPYREPRSGARRANIVLGSLHRFHLESTYWLRRTDGSTLNRWPSEAHALTAIARPERFIKTLESRGVRIIRRLYLPDHNPLTAGNLFIGFEPGSPLIVTAKDWVKIQSRTDLPQGCDILIAGYDAAIEPLAEFRSWLMNRIDEIDS